MEKTKKIIFILIPVIIVVAIIWGVIKTFFKNKTGEGTTVEDTVKEAVGFMKRALNILNDKNGN